MSFDHVRIAKSLISSFLLSQYPGALIARIFIIPFNLFKTKVVKTSESRSSAIITKSFCHD
jgi:hypothetical protein